MGTEYFYSEKKNQLYNHDKANSFICNFFFLLDIRPFAIGRLNCNILRGVFFFFFFEDCRRKKFGWNDPCDVRWRSSAILSFVYCSDGMIIPRFHLIAYYTIFLIHLRELFCIVYVFHQILHILKWFCLSQPTRILQRCK